MADPIKISDSSIGMDKVTPAIPEKRERQTYDRGFIEKQILAITEQRDTQIAEIVAKKEAELKECTDILKAMDDLGVTTKPVGIETIAQTEEIIGG